MGVRPYVGVAEGGFGVLVLVAVAVPATVGVPVITPEDIVRLLQPAGAEDGLIVKVTPEAGEAVAV